MNRGYPPPPPPPSPYRSAPRRQQQRMNDFVPANVLMQLIAQSQKRYAFTRDAAMKQDAGFQQLQMDSENIAIALEREDPEALEILDYWLKVVLQLAEAQRYLLDQQLQGERALQGGLKRFLMGQMGPPQNSELEAPGQGSPYRTPQLGQGRDPRGPQQEAPQIPVGADLRDPAAAAAVYARAEPMPLGALPTAPQQLPPQMMQPQQPQPLQPYMQYSVPPQQPMAPQYAPQPMMPQGMQPQQPMTPQMNLPLQPTYGPVTMPTAPLPIVQEGPPAATNGAAKTAS